MSRRGSLVVVCALSCAVVTLLPALHATAATPTVMAARPSVTIPAYTGPTRLEARPSSGGTVPYRLPEPGTGGIRAMADWDGIGSVHDGRWLLADKPTDPGPAFAANDGRTGSVDPAVAAQKDTYPGREEYAARNPATGWLALYVGDLGIGRLDRSTVAVPPVSALAGP